MAYRRCSCRRSRYKGAGGGGKGGYVRTKGKRGRRRGRGFFGGPGSQYTTYKTKGWPRGPPRKPRHSPYGRRKLRSKTIGNPWAICNWMAKKHRWSKAKKESCILKIKRKRGFGRRTRRIRRRRRRNTSWF